MKSSRLLALALTSMIGSIGAAAMTTMRDASMPKISIPKSMVPSRTVGSSRNGGRRGSNRGAQRAALKRRNVLRHRKACRG